MTIEKLAKLVKSTTVKSVKTIGGKNLNETAWEED